MDICDSITRVDYAYEYLKMNVNLFYIYSLHFEFKLL